MRALRHHIDYARPRRGSDKPHIERLWDTVGRNFSQYLAGYTGRPPGTPRPER
jgi:hypothetical protein